MQAALTWEVGMCSLSKGALHTVLPKPAKELQLNAWAHAGGVSGAECAGLHQRACKDEHHCAGARWHHPPALQGLRLRAHGADCGPDLDRGHPAPDPHQPCTTFSVKARCPSLSISVLCETSQPLLLSGEQGAWGDLCSPNDLQQALTLLHTGAAHGRDSKLQQLCGAPAADWPK